ncbi:MAG: hypothetical protein U0840_27345 [Gemmataceae bacterium]
MRDARSHVLVYSCWLILMSFALIRRDLASPPQMVSSQYQMDLVHPPSLEARSLLHRIARKDKVIERLLREELCLLEAAAWFRLIEGDRTGPTRQPGEGERLCRQVLHWVTVCHPPGFSTEGNSQRLIALEAEFESMHSAGEIALPW